MDSRKYRREEVSESDDHVTAKNFLASQLSKYNKVKSIEIEAGLKDTQPDVYLILANGKKVGVEYQRSFFDIGDFYRKLRKNTRKDVHTLYILGMKHFFLRFDKQEKNARIRGLGKLEKAINDIWKEVYCCCGPEEGIYRELWRSKIEEAPENFPESFEIKAKVRNKYKVIRKKRLFLKTVKLKSGRIRNFKLVCEKSHNFLIARFVNC